MQFPPTELQLWLGSPGICRPSQEGKPQNHATHCMIHRQALVVNALKPDLEQLMKDVTKIINFIKAQPLTTRLFRQLCEEADLEYSTLLLYCETRWLSRGNALYILWILRTEVEILMTDKKHCLAIHFEDKWLSQLAYLLGIFGQLERNQYESSWSKAQP